MSVLSYHHVLHEHTKRRARIHQEVPNLTLDTFSLVQSFSSMRTTVLLRKIFFFSFSSLVEYSLAMQKRDGVHSTILFKAGEKNNWKLLRPLRFSYTLVCLKCFSICPLGYKTDVPYLGLDLTVISLKLLPLSPYF